MKRYTVTVPIAGAICVEVEANSKEEAIQVAIENAFEDAWTENVLELDVYRRITTGNVLHVPFNELECDECDEDEP